MNTMLPAVRRTDLARVSLGVLLIFAAAIGGRMASGVVGIVVGPVVLAVAFTLLDAWP